MRIALLCLAATVAGMASPANAAGMAPPGASACSGCHGPAAATSVGPPIAGRPAADIAAAMQAFRSGERGGTVMPRIAKGFSSEESQAVAQWWSAVKP